MSCFLNRSKIFSMHDITDTEHNIDWESLSPDERKHALFAKQKSLLDTFLRTGAIDRRQYTKSLTCMAEKMGIKLDGSRQK